MAECLKIPDKAVLRSVMPGKPWKKKERPQVPEVSSDYKWSSQSYTLKEILNNFRLPVVVQCREDTNAENLQNFFFDLRQPVLLHSKRNSRKVFARCIRKGEGGTMKELLPEVVIPEDYAGWFKISKGLEFNKPSSHKTIDSLTRANTEFFLCTTELDAIVVTETSDGAGEFGGSFSRPVAEGEVLRKLDVQKLNMLMLPEAQRSLTRDNRYLLCIDEKDCELFIHVSQTGLFYEVSNGSLSKHDNSVVQMSDILDEMIELPIYVRHILGDPPSLSKFYSPCLKLMRVKEEETVMGSTIDAEEDALPLEIQTNSPIKFEIALNTPMLQSCTEYTEAVNLCNNVGQNYVTDMKLAVTFKVVQEDSSNETQGHRNPSFQPDENENLDSITNSQRTSTSAGRNSELGEVDANSEFSIKWDPDAQRMQQSPDCTTPVNLPEPDCVSIESVDEDQAMKLNTVLGGLYFDTNMNGGQQSKQIQTNLTSNKTDTWTRKRNLNTEINKENYTNAPSPIMYCRPIAPFEEDVTDFSIYSTLNVEDCSGPSTSTAILRPPSPFTNNNLESLPSSITVSTSKVYSSSSTLESGRSQIDLSEHFPSIHSSISNISTDPETVIQQGGYSFTGDVYVSPDTNSSCESVDQSFNSIESLDGSWETWNKNKFKVIKRKDLQEIRSIQAMSGAADKRMEASRSRSLSDDLMHFEEPSRTSSANSILTCKVADEMVSSFNDLRLSLEELTKKAHDKHMEYSWKQFCLERSSSLPVRSKNSPRDHTAHAHIDEHSQSWEQISPRRKDKALNLKTRQNTSSNVPTRTLNKLNINFSDSLDDKTQLISDTSSEDSANYSHRSTDTYTRDADDSFARSESDMSVTDGPESVLAAIAEMDIYLDGLSTASTSSAKSDHKSIVSQKLKINNEIKKKQLGEWNDIVEVI